MCTLMGLNNVVESWCTIFGCLEIHLLDSSRETDKNECQKKNRTFSTVSSQSVFFRSCKITAVIVKSLV